MIQKTEYFNFSDIVLGGDFNLVKNPEIDRLNESASNNVNSLEILKKYTYG